MKNKKRDIASEIIADLQELHATLAAGTPLEEKYTVHTVCAVSDLRIDHAIKASAGSTQQETLRTRAD